MPLHPAHHQRGQELAPIPRRRRERLAGGVFEALTRIGGLRPGILPEHLRRQLRVIGATDAQVDRVLPRLRSLAEWPYLWEAEGDARAARGDWQAAFTAWYVGQRILLAPTPLKRRLYALALEAYERVDQPRLERLAVENDRGERIAGYLQLPPGRDHERLPCVLMVPGITGTKEELHAYCMPLLRRGVAVARIDNPVYGETGGVLDHHSVVNARHVVRHLQRDARLDPARLHLHGMSLGAHFALHSALDTDVAGVTVICPPFRPGRYFATLPTLNLTAVQHMTRRRTFTDLVRFADELTLEHVAPRLTMPLRAFHGGRDRTIPVSDAIELTRAMGGPAALTIYERDHHNCLEHIDEITALTLEFVREPAETCARHGEIRRVDAPASLQPSDGAARLAGEGELPRRNLARLPFVLPGRRPSPGSASS